MRVLAVDRTEASVAAVWQDRRLRPARHAQRAVVLRAAVDEASRARGRRRRTGGPAAPQHRCRHRLPRDPGPFDPQVEARASARLEEPHLERVLARGERREALDLGHPVQSVVVRDERAIDEQLRAVVALDRQGPQPVRRDLEPACKQRAHVVGARRVGEVARGARVGERRHRGVQVRSERGEVGQRGRRGKRVVLGREPRERARDGGRSLERKLGARRAVELAGAVARVHLRPACGRAGRLDVRGAEAAAVADHEEPAVRGAVEAGRGDEPVDVGMHLLGDDVPVRDLRERCSAVGRGVHVVAARDHEARVRRMHPQRARVPARAARARHGDDGEVVPAIRALPDLAAIEGAHRVDDARVAWRIAELETVAEARDLGQPAGVRPGRSAVGRVDRAVHPLRGVVEQVRDGEVSVGGVEVDVERALAPSRVGPGRAAVGRALDAAIALRRKDDLRIRGRDRDAIDRVPSVGRGELRPRVAAVDRLVDAVAAERVAVELPLARAGVEDVRIRRVDRERAYRERRQPVPQRGPGRAAIGRAPHAAAHAARPHALRIGRIDDERARAAADIRRTVLLPGLARCDGAFALFESPCEVLLALLPAALDRSAGHAPALVGPCEPSPLDRLVGARRAREVRLGRRAHGHRDLRARGDGQHGQERQGAAVRHARNLAVPPNRTRMVARESAHARGSRTVRGVRETNDARAGCARAS